MMKKMLVIWLATFILTSCSPNQEIETKVYFLPWDLHEELSQTEVTIREKDPCWIFSGSSKNSEKARAIQKKLRRASKKLSQQNICTYDINLVCDLVVEGKIIESVAFSSKRCFWYKGKEYLDKENLLPIIQSILPPEHIEGMGSLPYFQGGCTEQDSN